MAIGDKEYEQGLQYETGQGVPKSIRTALTYYEKAIELGNSKALSAVAGLTLTALEEKRATFSQYEKSYVTSIEYEIGENNAIDYYKKRAEKKESIALFIMARLYEENFLKDVSESTRNDIIRENYTDCAKKGHIPSQCKLAQGYKIGNTYLKKDLTKALYWFKTAGDNGHIDSLYEAGLLCENSLDVNEKEARIYFKKAADAGHPLAKLKINQIQANELYPLGNAEEKRGNPKEAAAYYKKAMVLGHQNAKEKLLNLVSQKLALIKNNNLKLPEFTRETVVWLEYSADLDSSEAIDLLIKLYEINHAHVSYLMRDFWYRKAAEQGNILAQYRMGEKYLVTPYHSEDLKQAFFWFQKAANQGDSNALYKLGKIYELLHQETQAIGVYTELVKIGHHEAAHALKALCTRQIEHLTNLATLANNCLASPNKTISFPPPPWTIKACTKN